MPDEQCYERRAMDRERLARVEDQAKNISDSVVEIKAMLAKLITDVNGLNREHDRFKGARDAFIKIVGWLTILVSALYVIGWLRIPK